MSKCEPAAAIEDDFYADLNPLLKGKATACVSWMYYG